MQLILNVDLRNAVTIAASPKLLRPALKYIGEIFPIGFPSTLGSLLSSVANISVNSLTSEYGDIPVAAVGIVKKLDIFPLNVGMGLCQGMMPLVAYNYASQNYKRMRDAANFTRLHGMEFAALCVAVFELSAGGFVRLFIDEPETVAYGTDFLRIACLVNTVYDLQFPNDLYAAGNGKRQTIFAAVCLPPGHHQHFAAVHDESSVRTLWIDLDAITS